MNGLLPAPKSDFIGLKDKVHLATGGEPPLLVRHRDAFEAFAADKACGMDGYAQHWAVVDEVRALLAPHFSLAADEIALIGNASEGIVKALSSIDWKKGDNAVVYEQDYASGRYALAGLARYGVEIHLVPGNGWRIETSDLLAACNERTRAVYVSQVNAMTGQLIDIAPLSGALADTPTILILDASHAIGVVPVRADLADFTVSSCYKFVLGIHEGVFAWNRKRRPNFQPFGVGWAAANPEKNSRGHKLKPDARRAEYGNAGHLGAYLLRHSLHYLNAFGIEAIQEHAQTMVHRLITSMAASGCDVMTPNVPGEQAGNAAFVCTDTQEFVKKAAADGILVWGDNNRIRASAHLFTSRADVDYFLERMPGYL